jgi:hypothetical protein
VWPAPGSSNTLAWSDAPCSPTKPLVAGYFYVSAFSPDTLWATGPAGNPARVTLCDDSQVNVATARLGNAMFNAAGSGGCNPCSSDCEPPIAVEKTTWSGIKALFTR